MKGIFGLHDLEGQNKVLVFGVDSMIFFDPDTGSVEGKIDVEGPFGGIEMFIQQGKYLAVELAPTSTMNFRNYRLMIINLDSRQILQQLITGSINDGKKITMLEYTAFPELRLFVRFEMESKKNNLNGYSFFPPDAYEDDVNQKTYSEPVETKATATVSTEPTAVSAAPATPAPARTPEVIPSPSQNGKTPATAIVLKYQKIKLDGKADSWLGLEPLVAMAGYQAAYLGSTDYTFKQVVYMLR